VTRFARHPGAPVSVVEVRHDEAVDIDEDLLLNRVVLAEAVDQTFMRVDRACGYLHRLVVILTIIDEKQSDLHRVTHGQLEPSEPDRLSITAEML